MMSGIRRKLEREKEVIMSDSLEIIIVCDYVIVM